MKGPGPDGLYPYAGSSGWSGTDTSREAADKDDREGRTLRRHQLTMALLGDAGDDGWTVKELRDTYPEDHHGRWSAALSRAHKMGAICMLEEKRVGCHVYVLPDHVNDRATLPHRPRRISKKVREELRELAEAGDLEGILEYLEDGEQGHPSVPTSSPAPSRRRLVRRRVPVAAPPVPPQRRLSRRRPVHP